MKTSKRLLAGVLVLCAMMIWAAGTAFAITFGLQPTSQIINPGGTAFYSLRYFEESGAAPPTLGAYSFDLVFDPTLVSFNSITFGSFLGAPDTDYGLDIASPFESSIVVDSPSPGLLQVAEVSLLFSSDLTALQQGSSCCNLALISFQAANIENIRTPLSLSTAPHNKVPIMLRPFEIRYRP